MASNVQGSLNDPGLRALVEKLALDDQLRKQATDRVLAIETRIATLDLSHPELPPVVKLLESFLKIKTEYERAFNRTLREIEQHHVRRHREYIAESRLEIAQATESVQLAMLCRKHDLDTEEVMKVFLKHKQEDRLKRYGNPGGQNPDPGSPAEDQPYARD